MRQLSKSTSEIFYAHYSDYEPNTDGVYMTGEITSAFTAPQSVFVKVSADTAEAEYSSYGTARDSVRRITYVGKCPFGVGDAVWIENAVTEQHDYVCVSVRQEKHSCEVIVRKRQ